MSSQRLLFSDTVKISLFFFCTCLSPWKNKQNMSILELLHVWVRDWPPHTIAFCWCCLKAELIPEGACSLKSAVNREVFKAHKSLWPFLHFPVCLYHGWVGPLAWQVQEISWAQVIPELPTSLPCGLQPSTLLMLTLPPSSDTPLHKNFCLTVSHPSSINEPVPFGPTSMTRSSWLVACPWFRTASKWLINF